MSKIDNSMIKEIKLLALDMINKAGTGHPGIVLDAAEIIYSLYSDVLNYNPLEPDWINRDRFVLSSGHGSALLYATLYASGFDISIDELKRFRELNSITPGHPEVKLTPGVECTTGPLGQGVATAVGMAFAERYLENLIKTHKPKSKLIDYYTYCLCGDGDLMEGISYEALSFASTQKLNKLVIIYDRNKVSLDGSTDITFDENIIKRFEALNFNIINIKKSNYEEIKESLIEAKTSKKPTLIICNTIIGKDSMQEGTNKVHGKPLSIEDLNNIKEKYKHSLLPFDINEELIKNYKNKVLTRINKNIKKWQIEYEEVINSQNKNLISLINALQNGESLNFDDEIFKIEDDYLEELRLSNHKIMNVINSKTDLFMGGSADLSSSCKTNLENDGINLSVTPLGKNIFFGVRENAMGAILNGIALSGIRVFGSTFLTFSDYLKPSIRMSAMMNLPVTYIFTHDSIAVGTDGATHEPVEQLSSLRMIPNLNVFRPCDINEVIGSWDYILRSSIPSVLVISKEKTSKLLNTNSKYVKYGAYMIRKEAYHLDGVLIATGSEVNLALDVAKDLYKEGIDLRVVSMPCMELFLKQNPKYEQQLLPEGYKIFSIEAGNTLIWNRFVTKPNFAIGVNRFGKSGKKEEVLYEYGIEINKIKEFIKNNM